MSLTVLSLNNTNRPMESILWWASPEHGLDMDQPYQRGVVWGETRQRNLIKSLLMGVPIPSLVLNDRLGGKFAHPGWGDDRCWSTAVIDGKQRITSVLRFMRGELSIPADWLEERYLETKPGTADWIRWDDMTKVGHRHFRNMTISVSEARLRTLAQEESVFDLINYGGLAQGETD